MSELTEKVQLTRDERELILKHGEVGTDEDAVLDLCDRLEYAEQYGDGDLDILM